MDFCARRTTRPTASESELESQSGAGACEAPGDAQDKRIGGVGNTGDSSTTREKSGEGEEDHEYITGFKLIAVLGSVTLTAFLMLLDGSIIGTAVPSITSEFHSLDDVGWYVAAYQLARYVRFGVSTAAMKIRVTVSLIINSAALQPLTGKMYTQYSSKVTTLDDMV
ncbi:putative HC-toxin efflux carrier TOXA 21 [Colletotrichum chlorophyti]|uniref:Putative HC-toxin efflux carrier TOXA 21 n=1 Tax=Colletotrichum chlorophyti TaxID=708187 RepID=A0A1Q8RZJ2_9PEZI|nr:putative HC-toxin efflux carrier TOXA 21 [Colletotrichum chlorophyti]